MLKLISYFYMVYCNLDIVPRKIKYKDYLALKEKKKRRSEDGENVEDV